MNRLLQRSSAAQSQCLSGQDFPDTNDDPGLELAAAGRRQGESGSTRSDRIRGDHRRTAAATKTVALENPALAALRIARAYRGWLCCLAIPHQLRIHRRRAG